MNKIIMAIVGLEDCFLKDVVRLLKGNARIDIKYILGISDDLGAELGDEFPKCKTVALKRILSCDFAEEAIHDSGEKLSREIIDHFEGIKNEAMFMMDRFAFFSLSFAQKEKIFYGYLSYWWNFVKENQIDCFVFGATPHKVYDYLLFHVAKYFKIRTVYPERTLLDYRVLLLEDYRQIEKVPEDFLSDESNEQLRNHIGSEYGDLIDRESFWLRAARKKNRKKEEESRDKRVFSLKVHRGYEESFALNKKAGMLRKTFSQISKDNKYKYLSVYYERLMKGVEDDEKIILFPLHFQPERSTCPLGGIYADQLRAIEVLSESVPSDYKIYVKEHPRQMRNPRLNALNVRGKDFYDKIVSLKNVQLVDYKINNVDLIEKAAFVSTISGSTGWEALLKSKACITFGFPWYFACQSCYKVEDVVTCRKAIEAIERKDPETVRGDFLRFILFIKERLITTTNRCDMAVKSNNYSELARNLADAIVDRCGSEQNQAGMEKHVSLIH